MGCRRQASPDELVRLVAGPDASVLIGRTLPGRGAWLCAGSPPCLQLAVRRKALPRALRSPVSAQALSEVDRLLSA